MAPLRFVGTVVCLAVIVAYFYTPVPEGMNSDDQWQMRKLYALIQTDKLVVSGEKYFVLLKVG